MFESIAQGEKLFPLLVPRKYFITSGKAVSKVSALNAFDKALMEAGIAQCNLVAVSSILPRNSEEVGFQQIPPGTITFTILAKMNGRSGETISAGICYSVNEDYGLVAEAHGAVDERTLELDLKKKIREMADARRFKLGHVKTRIESMKVPPGNYGCVLVALVYVS